MPAATATPHQGTAPCDIRQPPGGDTLLRDRWPNGERLVVAFRLAKDLETCEALLLGHPVDPARIHERELQLALEPRLVQLVRPIDLITAA